MDVRRRPSKALRPAPKEPSSVPEPTGAKASDALPLPLYFTNALFFTLFFSVAYYLLLRWRDKIRNSVPLHVVTFSELAAILSLIASFIYLLGFFVDEEEGEDHRHRLMDCSPSMADHIIPAVSSAEDEEIVDLVVKGSIPSYALEEQLGDCKRAVRIRREALQRITRRSLQGLPLDGFDYGSILKQCCEMPIGYVQIPVGIAGPLLLDGFEYIVPMATTEGCIVASTNRGFKGIYASGGATSTILRDGMTRAPVVRFPSASRACHLKFFLDNPSNFQTLADEFNKSSNFARLQGVQCSISGKNLYTRFSCTTGETSVSTRNLPILTGLKGEGNWRCVICEAVIKEEVLKKLNMLKNLAGSAVAGALGGFNAHASNIVSAIFIATGQDPAQNVESSHCITMMEAVNDGKDLHISVTMPSIEVGTIGGGTQLASQSACLDLLGVKGASKELAGANSRLLAKIVAGSVLAGELSLMAAIASGQLVQSHMKYNRSTKDVSKVGS
ncbi:hypothetical protein GOBAR_DD17647 [Gossypium barbadense]|nr:hypothetical protein GOBAR_DD17647 [Gossypium barbadense]